MFMFGNKCEKFIKRLEFILCEFYNAEQEVCAAAPNQNNRICKRPSLCVQHEENLALGISALVVIGGLINNKHPMDTQRYRCILFIQMLM